MLQAAFDMSNENLNMVDWLLTLIVDSCKKKKKICRLAVLSVTTTGS